MESKNLILELGVSHEELKEVHLSKFNELEYVRIISAISHDISNPIGTLNSSIQLLKNNCSNNTAELNEDVLSICDESVAELVRFLNNLRLINTSIKSKIEPQISLFEIEAIANNQYIDLERLGLDHRRVSTRYDLDFKEFFSDLVMLRRILLSLLTNALKFSRTEVLLRISASQSNLEIEVKDSGVGIPENEIDQIFSLFFRGTNVTKIPGVGLGLSIVKVLTEGLGGQIYLKSLINQGTIIRIVIPNGYKN